MLTLVLLFALSSSPAFNPMPSPPVQEETPYEDPDDCECVFDPVSGRTICNSACTDRPK